MIPFITSTSRRTTQLAIVAGVAIAVYLVARKVGELGAGGVGQAIASSAIDAVDGVLTGTVTSVGEVIGIPKTDETECDKAIREGRTWDASFACPAKRFLSYAFS